MIVITGASDGIGEALVRKLSEQNEVVMLARTEAALHKIAQDTGARYFVCDVRDAKSVKQTFQKINDEIGSIDVLINNAGVIVNGQLTETDDEVIENVIKTNTTGAIYVAKYALENMQAKKKGLIINVISQAGVNARGTRSIYNASKWALTGFTKAMQEEAAELGIRVTGFYPGTIKTKLFEKAGLELSGKAMELRDIVTAIEYVIDQPDTVIIPHLEMRPF